MCSELDIRTNRISIFASDVRPSENHNLFRDFRDHINPIDPEEWQSAGRLGRTIIILQMPIRFLLSIVIPVVDYTRERHGWTKLLNIIHWLTLPLLFLAVTGSKLVKIFLMLFNMTLLQIFSKLF